MLLTIMSTPYLKAAAAPYYSYPCNKRTQLCGHNESITSLSNTNLFSSLSLSNERTPKVLVLCRARRRVRYEDEDEDEDEDDYGYNQEISILEMYSQSARGEALLVTAMVDDQQVELVIFKGFSSCLNYKTSSDPSKSVLPQRARIMSIDRIKGPFNPANVEYIEKGLTLETFINRFCSTG